MATNLELINSFEVTSSTSSFDVDNVFTDKYDVYYLSLTNFQTVGTTQTRIRIRFIDSTGTVETGSTYDYAYLQMDSIRAFAEPKNTNTTFLDYNLVDQAPTGAGLISYIYNPYSASSYTFSSWQNVSVWQAGALETRGTKGIGVEKTAQSIRGFQIFETDTRPFDKCRVSVYGVK
jgi:hypothetical protein